MIKSMPENVFRLFNDKATAKVLATRSSNGDIHVIPMGLLIAMDPNTIAVGKVSLRETHQNLERSKSGGQTASVLATKGMESYQFRCNVKEFVTSGPAFQTVNGIWEAARKNMPPSPDGKPFLPPVSGVWLLEPKEIINQGAGPNGRGKRL